MTSLRFAAFLALITLLAPATYADTLSTWTGGTGNWSDPTQWNPAQVPNNNGNQSYSVTVPTSGTISLDTNPTIDALALNGSLTNGYDPANGQFTILTVNRNAAVNGSIDGPGFYGWLDSLAIGGNLTNTGFVKIEAGLSVGGNMQNSGILIPYAFNSGFEVGGTLVNTGYIQWGNDADPGATTSLGGLINRGSIFIGVGTDIQVNPLNTSSDIPKSASWTIAGSLSGAFDNLRSIEGTLDLRNAITLGAPGSTIQNSGTVTLETADGTPNSVANVPGNFSNSGTVVIAQEEVESEPLGPSTLNVSGTFTNQSGATLTVNNPQYVTYPSPGSLNAQSLVNYGTANFESSAPSVLGQIINHGSINVYSEDPTVIASVITNSLTTAAGTLEVGPNAVLAVGSGSVPIGFTGYYQFANGIFVTAGGELFVDNSASLNGTLDILLGSDFKPIGTTYTILNADSLTGSFSDIEGLLFDNGAERYLLNYDRSMYNSEVTLTVEANTTPEPASILLTVLGAALLIATSRSYPQVNNE